MKDRNAMDMDKLKMLKAGKIIVVFCLLNTLPFLVRAQQLPPKEIKHLTQFWISINANASITDKWSILSDFHVRRNDFLKEPGFYLIRTGAAYKIHPKLSVAAGYAHLWTAAKKIGLNYYYLNENRIYEQAILTHKYGKVNFLHRFRNEQRWIEYSVNDNTSGKYRFTNRVRYLFNLRIPLFDNPKFPQLLLADEIMLHFGKAVTYSNFEQNRIYVGINQPISKTVSFDLGYMYIYQLRISGYQYNISNVIRLFFYYSPDWRKKSIEKSNTHKDLLND